jgi:hypothetical protein
MKGRMDKYQAYLYIRGCSDRTAVGNETNQINIITKSFSAELTEIKLTIMVSLRRTRIANHIA